jgi:hypothetical protein
MYKYLRPRMLHANDVDELCEVGTHHSGIVSMQFAGDVRSHRLRVLHMLCHSHVQTTRNYCITENLRCLYDICQYCLILLVHVLC